MTSDADPELERWDNVMDALALGEAVAPQDLEFVRKYAQAHPLCRTEERLFAELPLLASGQSAPEEDSLLMQQVFEELEQPPPATTRRRWRPIALGIGGVIALVALAMWLRTPTEPPAHQAPERASAKGSSRALGSAMRVVDGAVRVEGQALAIGSELPYGHTLTCAEPRTCLEYLHVKLCCDESTSMRLTEVDGLVIELSGGKLQVAARSDNTTPITVATEHGRAWTTTGLFRLIYAPDDQGYELEVLAGPVMAEGAPGVVRELASGERLDRRVGSAP